MQFASPVTRPQRTSSGICMNISFPLLHEKKERRRAQREANQGTETVTHQLLTNTLESLGSGFTPQHSPVFVDGKQKKCAKKSERCGPVKARKVCSV